MILDCFTCDKNKECGPGSSISKPNVAGCIEYSGFEPLDEIETMIDSEFQTIEEYYETAD